MEIKNLIYSTAEKYQKTTILERLKAFEACQQLKIGFVGMFSAGKTSLINALLDIHLPVNPNPTTKSICVFESDDNLEKYEYFLEIDGERKKSSFVEFEDVVAGRNTGVAVIRVPVKNEIPSGIVYVDTPGVDNYAAEETDLTYRYLALLDAAVVCIDINEGTIKKNLFDFISVPELFSLSSRMFFVLTHADTKNQAGINAISENIYTQIIKFAGKTKFNVENLKERIIAINANEHDSAMQVVNFINSYVLDKRENIYRERIHNNEKKLAKELAVMLQDDLKNLSFDSTELNNKKSTLENELSIITKEIDKKNNQLEKLKFELSNNIYNILKSQELAIISAPDSEIIGQIFNNINQEIANLAQSKLKRISENIVVPIADGIGVDLITKFGRIDFFKNLTVTIATATLTAWMAPGASNVANATEGAAGAAAQTAGKNATTSAIKEVAKNSMKKTALQILEVDDNKNINQGQSVGTFNKIFREIGQLIHNINPLEMVGDWVASEIKHNTFTSIIKSKSIQIADNIIFSIEDIFQDEVITPLNDRYCEQSASLERLIDEREKNLKDFSKIRNELSIIINKLNLL